MEAAKIILLVEDNTDDVELTLRAFRKVQLANRIMVAKDGVEALDYLFRNGTFSKRDPEAIPQLILLDLKLPKIDGFEVLEKIRAHEQTKLLPVVILTSSREQEDLLKCYGLGANSYIRKPVNFDQFVEAIRQIELYWLVLNEPPPHIR